ncbi:MAG: PAS domain S-box protein [Chloroflexota bacterium]|nr:PAS domain S-box protein [Chloroflexota bacterium]
MPAELTAAERDPAGLGPVNILLVDDEPKNLTALTAVLEGEDRRLVFAYSGEEALRHLLHTDFAVILLDVHMPGIDGFETAELIRNREKTRDTPIIFLTAASRGETFVTRGYSLGAVDYIVKPFDPEALRSKVAVFVDLFRKTEQVKRQAAELTETTTFLNSVLESAPDYAIVALDQDGRFLTWNEGARKVYGYAAEEMVGKRDLAALHPKEDAGRVRQLLRTTARSGKAEAMFDGLRKNGRKFPASVTLGQRRDAEGRPVGYVLITRDITDLKRSEAQRAQLIEEQAARSEAEAARDRLQQVLDVLPEAVVLADAEGHVLMSNGAVQEITGQRPPRNEETGHARFDMLRTDGEPYPPDEQPLARIVRRGEIVRGEQVLVRHVTKEEPVPVLVNGAPLRDARGELAGGVMVFQDISPIKDLAAQKDAFLAAASHDLKNPLTSIKARAQMLQRRAARVEGADGLALLDGLRAIDQTTTRITSMINELLDVARLQMGRPLLLDRETMDLVELARQVVADYQPATDRHELRVEVETTQSVGEWDRPRLERVLSNLVSNAIKFSPDGGRITVRVREERRDDADWVALDVQDQGVGIPADDLPHVFERFFRGSNVTGTIEGTGLGLAGACQIVEQHGGSLTVESREGKGSTFTVRLPLQAEVGRTEAPCGDRSPAVAAS